MDRYLAWDPNHLGENKQGRNALASRSINWAANWLKKLVPGALSATRTQNFPQTLCLLKAIPFATLPLLLSLDFAVTINHLRIMLSTISNYTSALKKKHHDDLTDYDRGKFDGIISAHVYFFILGMTFELSGVYKGRW